MQHDCESSPQRQGTRPNEQNETASAVAKEKSKKCEPI